MSENENTSKKKWKINWTTDKIMSTSALFISVISLIALLYQSYLAREENKLIQMQQSASVLPYLNQWYSDHNDQFRLIVGNKGVGPAFIKDVEIILDSEDTLYNSANLFKKIFTTKKGLDTIPYTQSTLIKGFVLPANDVIDILEINSKDNINAFKRVFATLDVKFKIVYEDVYGSQWMLSNNHSESNTPIKMN